MLLNGARSSALAGLKDKAREATLRPSEGTAMVLERRASDTATLVSRRKLNIVVSLATKERSVGVFMQRSKE